MDEAQRLLFVRERTIKSTNEEISEEVSEEMKEEEEEEQESKRALLVDKLSLARYFQFSTACFNSICSMPFQSCKQITRSGQDSATDVNCTAGVD